MGLTGAGGALVSIPLFIHLLGSSLKEATILSLIAVILGTAINLFSQVKSANIKVALLMGLAGTSSAYLSLGIKSTLSDLLIVVLLTAIGTYSLWSVWTEQKKPGLTVNADKIILKSISAGVLIGFLTTLTGLGGGVLLIPILIKFFGKTYDEALPTSLLTIFIIAASSLALQINAAHSIVNLKVTGLIGAGAVVSLALLSKLIRKMSEQLVKKIRKTVFTLVVFYALAGVISKIL